MARGRTRRRQAPDGPYETHIEDLSQDARGVARVDGKVIFIADALAGEQVRYLRTRTRAQFDEGVLDSVLQASPERVEPRCQHFGYCGGCSLQHLSAQAQLVFKQHQLLEALERIGKVQPVTVSAPLSGPQWHYRRRARLGVKHVPGKGRTLVGFRERAHPYIADIQRCEILQSPLDDLLLPLSTLIGSLSIYKALPQIEVAVADNGVALVLRTLEQPTEDDLLRLQQFAKQHAVWFYLQPGGLDSVTPLAVDTPELTYAIDDGAVTLAFKPVDFLQINAELNQAMVAQAIDWLQPQAAEQGLELFCGLGNFSLPLARRVSGITAVEGDDSLVIRARDNARRNHLSNVRFHSADLFEDQSEAPWFRSGYDFALIDPPRAGAEAAVGALARMDIARILYVSCHPATLARDAGILVHEYGYTLKQAGVMDMFPHTQHVESMALFVKPQQGQS